LLGVALTVGLVAAEALLLSRLGVEFLPITFLIAALVTVAGSLVYAYWVGRKRNDAFFVLLLMIAMTLLAVATLGAWLRWVWIPPALFCLYFLSFAVFLNHYWTFTWDYFDTLSTKRLFPLFSAGYSLGSLTGGGLAVVVVRVGPPEVLVAVWGLALGVVAILLRAARRRLRRWGPLELEEADETSVEGIQRAIRYIRGSSLGRWLVVSTVGMVLALFVAQYLYSEIFLREYPGEEELAAFLGTFLAVTNGLEVLLAVAVVPRLIERLGVARANLIHPVLTLVSFVVLAMDYRLGAAIAARVNRELVENAVAEPVRNLVYNALPFRFRGRIRAFLEGIVVYSGMALAGGLLLAVGGRVAPLWLCLAGVGTAVLYLLANLRVRREYLNALAEELRFGRLDLAEIGGEIGNWEATRLAGLWDALLEEETKPTFRVELDLAPLLARRGVVEPLLRAASHPDFRVRRACIEALASVPDGKPIRTIAAGLRDPHPAVRRAALRGLGPEGCIPEAALAAAVRARLEDQDPGVRAEAAARLGAEGAGVLAGMARDLDPGKAIVALRRLPAGLLEIALERACDPDPGIRAEALECVVRLARHLPLSREHLSAELGHADVRVRLAALRALAATEDPAESDTLARGLNDSSREVRSLARDSLGRLGDAGAMAASVYLEAARMPTVAAALGAIAAAGTSRARRMLGEKLRHHVHEVWRQLLVLHAIEAVEDSRFRFLKLAYENAFARSLRTAFLILELSEDTRLVQTVMKVLRLASARARGDALEVLSNLGDREVARLLVLLLEAGPLEEKIPLVADLFRPPRGRDAILEAARMNRNPWVQRVYTILKAEGRDRENGDQVMERMLYLRRVPLFSQLTLDQLDAINRILSESRYVKDEVICREGDIGSDLYVLIDGEVEVFKGYETDQPLRLATLSPVSCFGEMAVLSDEPRSATVVASREARLLTLEGERLKELILHMPEIAFDFFGVLTGRLRSADERYEELARRAMPQR
jgi:HEAT repeat protein